MLELQSDLPDSAEVAPEVGEGGTAEAWFREDAERLGYLAPEGGGMMAYRRDFGILADERPPAREISGGDMDDRPRHVETHPGGHVMVRLPSGPIQVAALGRADEDASGMFDSQSIVGNPFALDRFTEDETALLEARQLGGIPDLPRTSEEEERRAIIQARAEASLGSAKQRFWGKVRIPEDERACWEWTGSKNQRGIGKFEAGGKAVTAHRFAWSLYHPDIPIPIRLSQSCGNRACVKEEHLK